MIKLDLTKSAEALRLDLTKRGVDPAQLRAQVIINMDVSGSFEGEHIKGITNQLMARLLPWGLVFDVNGEIDVFTFSDKEDGAHHVGTVDRNTYDGYVKREIIGKVPRWSSGTDYSHVLRKNLRHFGWIPDETKAESKRGFFSKLLGKPEPAANSSPVKKDRTFVIMITDGENNSNDKEPTRRLLAESQARQDEVYFLFIGYSSAGAAFSFLKEISDKYANTGLVVIDDLEKFTNMPDDELNELLIGDELVTWLKA